MKKNKIIYYLVTYEQNGKIEKQIYPTIDKAISNIKVLVSMNKCVQFQRLTLEVEL